MKQLSLVFLGAGPVAAASLASLLKNFTIEFVITKHRKHDRDPAPVEDLAKTHDLPLQFANAKQELDELFANHPPKSRLGVIVDYGVIVSQQVIDSFPLGIVNSHFSRLPEWRGADPITFAILSGQKSTGVSLMIIEPTLDTGKIIVQKSLDISPNDTTPTLTEKLVRLSNELLAEYLPKYANGEVKPRQQPHPDRATFSRKITKEDGILDPATMTADEMERKVRAFVGWPKTRLAGSYFLGSRNKSENDAMVIITGAKVLTFEPGDNWPDVIACADDTFLQITGLINPKSGKQMKTADYLRGLKS